MKKLFLLLALTFLSAQSFAGSCPDGSEPVKSVSADGTYFVYNCGGDSNNAKDTKESEAESPSSKSGFTQVTPSVSSTNISMPTYFFTDEINKTCKVKKGEIESVSVVVDDWDLTDPDTYEWLENLQHYSWVKDHAKRSNSLDVNFRQLTDRLGFVNTAITNSIIDGTMETQAPKAIDLMITWAEAGVIMDSTSVAEIQAMRKAGTFTRCYKGKGDEEAVCHWHTTQEAARYAGQFAIIATMVQPYMNYKQLTITEDYLNAMYKKYINPWYFSSGSGDTEGKGFYQMGHGAISMLAYAHWKNDKKLATYAFESTFKFIDDVVFDDGLINNNSFRGVRGYWYHSLALNNMLGMVALAEEWNYPVQDEIYNKLTSAVEFLNRDSVEHLAWLEGLKKYNVSNGNPYTKYKGKEVYLGNVSWKHKNARNHIHQLAVFLDYLAETYTKASFNKDSKEYKIYNHKKRNKTNDKQLGFNPTCITK